MVWVGGPDARARPCVNRELPALAFAFDDVADALVECRHALFS